MLKYHFDGELVDGLIATKDGWCIHILAKLGVCIYIYRFLIYLLNIYIYIVLSD